MKTKPFAIFPALLVVLSLVALGAGPQNILGVTVQRPSGSGTGVQIVSVAPGSACQSVLPKGDIIAYLNPNGGLTGNRSQDLAYEVGNLTDFQSLVSKIRPGATATFLLLSGTSAMAPARKVACRIPGNAAMPASTPAAAPAAAPASGQGGQALLGITTKKPVGNSGGVAVASVDAGSPCQSVLHVGDVISFLNPNGSLSGAPATDRPYQVRDQAQFASQAAQIRPGAIVGMRVLPASAFMSTGNIVTCNIPAGGAAAGETGEQAAADNTPTATVPQNILGIIVADDLTGPEKGSYVGGLRVKQVAPGSPCAGVLQAGNVITYLSPSGPVMMPPTAKGNTGKHLQSMNDFNRLIAQVKPGATVGFLLYPGRSMFEMAHTAICAIPN